MWIFRELARLIGRIAVAVLIALIIAEAKALISGGDTLWTFRITCLLLGCLFLLLGAAGTGSAASWRVNWGVVTPGRGGFIMHGFRPKPGDPRLTPGAVFIGRGFVLLALGAVL